MGVMDGKVAVVTGAGQGVGQGIALALASEGASVAVLGRTLGKLEATCDLLRERGDPAAVEWLEAARQSYAAAGQKAGLSEADQRLGLVAMARGDYQQALAAFESAHEIWYAVSESTMASVGNDGCVSCR